MLLYLAYQSENGGDRVSILHEQGTVWTYPQVLQFVIELQILQLLMQLRIFTFDFAVTIARLFQQVNERNISITAAVQFSDEVPQIGTGCSFLQGPLLHRHDSATESSIFKREQWRLRQPVWPAAVRMLHILAIDDEIFAILGIAVALQRLLQLLLSPLYVLIKRCGKSKALLALGAIVVAANALVFQLPGQLWLWANGVLALAACVLILKLFLWQ